MSRKISETPDRLHYRGKRLQDSDPDAWAFGYSGGNFRMGHARTHDGIDLDNPLLPNYDEGDKYLGRIWINEKVISFWKYPESKSKLWSILQDIKEYISEYGDSETRFDRSFGIEDLDFGSGEWLIEVPKKASGETTWQDLDDDETRNMFSGEHSELIPLLRFDGIEEVPEDFEKKRKKRAQKHMDPDIGAGGVDKGTYQLKKQKGKEMDRYSGGGETEKLGYKVGGDPEYSDEIERFREVVREFVKDLL